MSNLFSLSDVVRRGHWVTMDTEQANAFFVHTRSGNVVEYACNEAGLYVKTKIQRKRNHLCVPAGENDPDSDDESDDEVPPSLLRREE